MSGAVDRAASGGGPGVPLTLNLSQYCRLEGGRILPGEPALCLAPMSVLPDPTSCYSGPNNAFWVDRVGCVGNLVNSCVALPTYKSWEWDGDDVICHYDFSDNLCAGVDLRAAGGGDGGGGGGGPDAQTAAGIGAAPTAVHHPAGPFHVGAASQRQKY